MVVSVTPDMRDTIRSAAAKLTGYRRRQFQAEMAVKYCDSRRASPKEYSVGDAIPSRPDCTNAGPESAVWNGSKNAAARKPKTSRRRSSPRFAAWSNPRHRSIPPLNRRWRSPASRPSRTRRTAQRSRARPACAVSPNDRQHAQSTRLPVAAGDQGAPSKKIAETNAIFDNIDAARERARIIHEQ